MLLEGGQHEEKAEKEHEAGRLSTINTFLPASGGEGLRMKEDLCLHEEEQVGVKAGQEDVEYTNYLYFFFQVST